jgi:hypothetical protein
MAEFEPKIERKKTIEDLNIKEQWDSQIATLSKSGILEIFTESQELGIRGIDGKEYPVPEAEDIAQYLEANKEMIEKKMEQGFTKLILEPFAISLDVLTEKYTQSILRHFKEGTLLATKKNPEDPDVPLDLDVNQPLWKWDGYNNADGEGKLVYDPKEFSQNHGGKTKIEILTESGQGWNIWLLEDMPNIPRENKGEEIGERKQIEANKTPNEYLKITGTGVYEDESGITPEVDIMCAITQLEETNQVSNDYAGNGSASYQLGAYFVSDGYVPYSYWNLDTRQADLSRYDPSNQDSDSGARFGVRVNKKEEDLDL